MYWNTLHGALEEPQNSYQALLRFVNAREVYWGMAHMESIRILRECGWTAADITAAYIHNRFSTSTLRLSPDVAAEIARQDWSTALQL